MAVVAQQLVGRARVVAVVVCNQDSGDVFYVYFVLFQPLLDNVGVNAGVDEDAALRVAQVGAVARRARAERDETQAAGTCPAMAAQCTPTTI